MDGEVVIRSEKEEAAKLHIEQIRRQKFGIGSDHPATKPMGKTLHGALTNISRDVKQLKIPNVNFIRELILNADENEYEEGVKPELRFVLVFDDITETGATHTLLVFNNEVGFSRENMECICGIFQSTKKGKRQQQTGNGFKSVFSVCSQPYVFSNGYRVRFQKEPDQDCGVGYIVPQWVSGPPSLSSISDLYRFDNGIPATTIILPINRFMSKTVTDQLSQLCSESLLFLSKLKGLHVRYPKRIANPWDNLPPPEYSASFCKDVNSDIVVLQTKVKDYIEESSNYYLCESIFPVKPESRVGARLDVQNFLITIAFPLNDRRVANSSGDIFAFLPTNMLTDSHFLIQADFILNSSRDSVLLDNEWNLGIHSCIPSAFVKAFKSLSLRDPTQNIFYLLPAEASSFSNFNDLRESIRTELQSLEIVPCEVIAGVSSYARPQEVVRVCPEFRCLMDEFKRKGYTSGSLPMRILLSSLDLEEYNAVLEYVGVKFADDHWYTECIQSLCSSADKEVPGDGIMLLLKYIENLMSSSPYDTVLRFLKKIIAKSKCMKTWESLHITKSYLMPEECMLFDPEWESLIKFEQIQKQTPSIAESFHRDEIHEYKYQLRDIGVKVDPLSICSLLYGVLSKWPEELKKGIERPALSIVSIYQFMSKFQWRPEVPPSLIFTNNDHRDWVPPDMCVFHGEEHLLGPRKYALDHNYKDELLPLFCSGFGVKEKPSIDEYLDFLKENEGEVNLEEFYCSFWKSIADNWNPIIQKSLKEKLTQVPATKSTSEEICLIDSTEAFLADDLYLKKLFSSYDKDPLFVWCPSSDIVSPIRLHEIYESLGVRKVSKIVKRMEEEIGGAVEVTPIHGLINKGLIKLILGFLAGRQVDMSLEERQVAVSSVVGLETCRIHPPYELLCRLQRPKRPLAEVKEVKLVHWTQTSKQLFIDSTRYDNMKSDPELIAAFADELAQQLLPHTKHYAARKNLSLMIQFWFMMDFNEEKVDDMLSRENLQLSAEDCEFVDDLSLLNLL